MKNGRTSSANASGKSPVKSSAKSPVKSPESGHQQVVEFLDKLEHPLKTEIVEIRDIILSVNEHMTEHIKWNAPSFRINGEDRVTFNLFGKDRFRLIFHCGAKASGRAKNEPLFEDETKLLEWAAGDRAVISFTGKHDVEAKKDKLVEVVAKWLEATADL